MDKINQNIDIPRDNLTPSLQPKDKLQKKTNPKTIILITLICLSLLFLTISLIAPNLSNKNFQNNTKPNTTTIQTPSPSNDNPWQIKLNQISSNLNQNGQIPPITIEKDITF